MLKFDYITGNIHKITEDFFVAFLTIINLKWSKRKLRNGWLLTLNKITASTRTHFANELMLAVPFNPQSVMIAFF